MTDSARADAVAGMPTAGFSFAGTTYIVGHHPNKRVKTMYLFREQGTTYEAVARFSDAESAMQYREWLVTMVESAMRGAKAFDDTPPASAAGDGAEGEA